MPLPDSGGSREYVHHRSIDIRGYRRNDGLWDIEGHLTDAKQYELMMLRGSLPAGEPLHEMWLRITVDDALLIVRVVAVMDATPHPGTCDSISGYYQELEGMRIAPGFRRDVLSRFGQLKGCTHLTDLILAVATGAYQTVSGFVSGSPDVAPLFLDGCHALDRGGPIVTRLYPEWAGKAKRNPSAE